MSLENIKKEIEAKAAATADGIIAEAEKKVAEIKEKAASEAKKLAEEASTKLESEVTILKNRESSLANMEAQKKLFEAKKEEIAAVYEEAKQKIHDMPAAERERAVKKMLSKAKEEIDVAVVYANKEDSKFVEGADTKNMDTPGCIICETKDGAVRVDYTFPTLFSQVKENTLAEVSKKLFD